MTNKVILLNSRPVGRPTLHDFKFIEEAMPVADDGEVLLKTLYVSVDPYLRGRMNDTKSYVPPFKLNKPIQSGIIAEVTDSNGSSLKIGDVVSGSLDWKQYQVSKADGLSKIKADNDELSLYLGILGMTGLTAYCGLTVIGKPKAGETVVVSGAAGAVGSVVGQIAKIMGCRVVGITGSDEKVDMLKSKLKFDEAINYKTSEDLKATIEKACPHGVDIYFDNVGGDISEAVLNNINKYARMVICGAISLYNETKRPLGPLVQPVLVTKSATMAGFIVSDFTEHFAEATQKLSAWVKEGKLVSQETVVNGFDNIPEAFLGLFDGNNEGKMIVKI